MFETLLVICAVFLIIASLHDLKTKEVPDYLSYVFIASGIIIQVYYILKNQDWSYGCVVFLNFMFGTCFGFLMYFARQWGGADAKLTSALSLYLSTPNNAWLFANFFINFLLIGAFYGVAGSFFLIIKNWKKYARLIKRDFGKKRVYYLTGFGISGMGIIILLFNPVIGLLTILIGLLSVGVLALKNADELMIKTISVSRLVEGDWVIDKIVVRGKTVFDPNKQVDIKKSQIRRLEELGVKKVRIRDGIPFIPAFLLGFVLTIIKYDFFYGLLTGLAVSGL